MSTISADAPLFDDAMVVRWRSDRALWLAFAISLLLHAAAVALLPSLSVPPPKSAVLTVEFGRNTAPKPEVQEELAPKKPAAKRAEPQIEKPFERQNLQAAAGPISPPQARPVDPRKEVSAVPRVEPKIEARPNVPEPAPVMHPEPHPVPDTQPSPQPRVERAPAVPAAPARAEPSVEHQADVRPEPRMEARVEPRLEPAEPRPAPRSETRVEAVPTARPQPAPKAQAEQIIAAQPRPEYSAVPPKMDAAPVAPRSERQHELKPESRTAPTIAARPMPVVEPPPLPAANATPRPESLAARKPQPLADPRQEVKPETSSPPAVAPRGPTVAETPRGAEMQPTVPMPQPVPQPLEHRAEPPVVAAPVQRAPEIRREVKLEPAIQAYAPAVATLDPAAPVEQTRVREPIVAAPMQRAPEIRREVKAEPAIQAYTPAVATLDHPAPVEHPRTREEPKVSPPVSMAAIPAPAKRNKADEEAAMRRYASEISKLIAKGVSERDYPRLARDRRWQGTTQLVLRIHVDGSLSEVIVATSSGYGILDERAIEVVNQIKLPAVPSEIQSRAFAVRIPVRFDLKE